MSHVSTKNKTKHEINDRKHEGMHDSHFYENITKRETVFETGAHR